MPKALPFLFSAFAALSSGFPTPRTEAAQKPSIFLVVIDDFGFANFGPHRTPADDPNHEVQTPVMDALAAEGLLLERNYLYWYCSPSRSALQSGRNPIHVNLNNDELFLANPAEPTTGGYSGVPRNMTCIGTKLGMAGYETHFYGKHHIGMATADHTPAGRGWEHSLIYFDGANDYFTSQSGSCGSTPITDLWKDDAPAYGMNNSYSCSQTNQPASGVYEDAMFLNETLHAIENRDVSRPFFQIWAPHNIHAPLQVPAAYLANFSFIGDSRRQAYAAKVKYTDDALGLVVTALKAAGMWDNLLFGELQITKTPPAVPHYHPATPTQTQSPHHTVLTADNGGPIYDSGAAGANNWPLKGGKTSNWEGGVRGNGIVSGGLLPAARRGAIENGFIQIVSAHSSKSYNTDAQTQFPFFCAPLPPRPAPPYTLAPLQYSPTGGLVRNLLRHRWRFHLRCARRCRGPAAGGLH